jgi:hypothetical protein
MSARNETENETESAAAPLSREELIALIAGAHHASAYSDSALAGRMLAAQSKLPKLIAENLGAGFGQWDFFPEAADIVDFALAYEPPSTQEQLWTLVRSWASDHAASRQTVMALVGREIVQHELRRIDVPKLRELFSEARPARARELQVSLGLEVRPLDPAKPEIKRSPRSTAAPHAKRAAAPVGAREIPARMPKPQFKSPPKPAAAPDARRFTHPKFGEGVLKSQDGVGPDAKLTIHFESGPRTLLARYVTELPR